MSHAASVENPSAEPHGHEHVVDVFEPAMEHVFNGKMAMWLFLASEIMFFSGLIGAFITLKLTNAELFAASQIDLKKDMLVVGINTAILLLSSVTMAIAIKGGRNGDRKKLGTFLLITAILGSAFLVLKGYDYNHHIHENLLPSTNLFWSFYYAMTGAHALHILAGVLPMFGIWIAGLKRDVTAETEIVGLYWQFVDIVWIVAILPTLYFI